MTSDDAYSYISESHACHNNTTLSEKVDTFINGEVMPREGGGYLVDSLGGDCATLVNDTLF